jgi:hypothetical protein
MQPERCSRPDTGHQLAGVVLVSHTLNCRSVERASLEAGYRCDAAKKLIPFRGLRVSQYIQCRSKQKCPMLWIDSVSSERGVSTWPEPIASRWEERFPYAGCAKRGLYYFSS